MGSGRSPRHGAHICVQQLSCRVMEGLLFIRRFEINGTESYTN